MPSLALKMNLLSGWGIAPTAAPSALLGGVQRFPTKLVITPEGEILIDLNNLMVDLNGQVFLSFGGVYTSLDGHLLLNLNMNKPTYMIID